jgi:hypothetical protein
MRVVTLLAMILLPAASATSWGQTDGRVAPPAEPDTALTGPDTQPAGRDASPPDEQADEALIRRLREGAGDPADLEQRILDLMQVARDHLNVRFDAGEVTQNAQREIVRELDAAIELARQNLRRSKGSGDQPRQTGEKRKAGERQEQQAADAAQPGGDSAGASTQPGQAADTIRGPGGEITEHRRGWGTLPDRDREAVIQGLREDSLSEYAELIEAYYRALSEVTEE